MGLEGKGSWPHSGCRGRRSGLGEAMMVANRRRISSAAGDGEDGVGGDAGRPAGHWLVERKSGSRWSLWAQRRGEAVAVATATLVGGGGSVRVRGRESRGEDEARERVRESQGLRGAPWRRLGGAGEAGGGRKRTCARRASPLPTGRRKKTALPSVGWAATMPEQVGRPR